jgi:hypothetical protein
VRTDASNAKEMVRSGVIALDPEEVADLRRRRVEEFIEYMEYLKTEAPVNGDVRAFLRDQKKELSTRLIRREDKRLQEKKAVYLTARTTEIRERFLDDWVRKLELEFKGFIERTDRIIALYKSLANPELDKLAGDGVADALEEFHSTLASLCEGVQESLMSTSEGNGGKEGNSTQTESRERWTQLLDLITQMEFGQYMNSVFDEMAVYMNERERKNNEDPADSLLDFVNQTVARHRSMSAFPPAFNRAETEWKSLELDATSALDRDVDNMIAPLMSSFQESGELYAHAKKLLAEIGKEQAKLADRMRSKGVDVFQRAEWNNQQSVSESVLRHPAFVQLEGQAQRWPKQSCVPALQKIYRSITPQSCLGRCRLDSRDIQALLKEMDKEPARYLSLAQFWTYGHLAYFSAMLVDQQRMGRQ